MLSWTMFHDVRGTFARQEQLRAQRMICSNYPGIDDRYTNGCLLTPHLQQLHMIDFWLILDSVQNNFADIKQGISLFVCNPVLAQFSFDPKRDLPIRTKSMQHMQPCMPCSKELGKFCPIMSCPILWFGPRKHAAPAKAFCSMLPVGSFGAEPWQNHNDPRLQHHLASPQGLVHPDSTMPRTSQS